MRRPPRALLVLLAGAGLLMACGPAAMTGSDQTRAVDANDDAALEAGEFAAGPLLFVVTLPRENLRLGDPVPLTMTLVNISPTRQRVNQRLAANERSAPIELWEVTLRIAAPGDRPARARWDARIDFPAPEDFADLAPGQQVRATVDLADRFELRQRGAYTIRATYHNTHAGPVLIDDSSGLITETDIGAVTGRFAAPPVVLRLR